MGQSVGEVSLERNADAMRRALLPVQLSRQQVRALVGGVVALAVLVVVVASPTLLGDEVGKALGNIADASPLYLWLAAASSLSSLFCASCAWRASLRTCGARASVADAASRYGVGSLVSAFAPVGVGGAVRIGLFSRI